MGSFFAGIKAGTLGGVFYIGGLALFNTALLYGFKGEVLRIMSQDYPTICPSTNSTSIQTCFNSVASVYIPYIAFIGFFVSLFFAGLFGWSYETFPGRSPIAKGEVTALLVALGLILGDLYGFTIGALPTALLAVFFVIWTGAYGYVLGRLYKRYTRSVKFESVDDKLAKVIVDGKDYTGRLRTFALTSTHEVKAGLSEGASFKQWEVSGGITVEDPRSFETLMEVNGDGLLKVQSMRKH